jgi:hypothetical protein
MVGFYQIYWDEKQLERLFPFATPYKNDTLTPFFENSVIAHLIPCSAHTKIAVCSWNLMNKMRTNIPPYRQLTQELLESDFDVLSFTKNSPGHGMLTIADTWHPNFTDILRVIMTHLGFKLPKEVKYPIYQNAFCARTEIYQQYVKEMLIPAMEVMENDMVIRELCWMDSGYYKLRNIPEFAQRVKQFLGTDYCPLHTFLCERFFSVWLNDKKFNVQYI